MPSSPFRRVRIALPRREAVLGLAALVAACATRPGLRVGADGVGREARPGTAPGIVFENGLGVALSQWDAVRRGLPPDAAVFAYDRPGTGASAPAATPRDGATIVAELRRLLAAEALAPPHILVGHSFGGLTMQLFARTYPHEVAALILVDATHPRQFEGDGALERIPGWARLGIGLVLGRAAQAELAAIPETGRQVLALPPPPVPVIILSAARPMRDASSPAELHANALRRDFAALYPGARQIWVESGHDMPREAPAAIIDAIIAARAAGA